MGVRSESSAPRTKFRTTAFCALSAYALIGFSTMAALGLIASQAGCASTAPRPAERPAASLATDAGVEAPAPLDAGDSEREADDTHWADRAGQVALVVLGVAAAVGSALLPLFLF